MLLICHVISQDHVIKESSDFISRSPSFISKSSVSYHPAKYGCYRHSGRGDIMVFVCHMTLQEHVTKARSNLMIRSPSR